MCNLRFRMTRTWKCTICGLVDSFLSPPEHCPECSAVKAMFVPSTEAQHGIEHNPIQPHDNHHGEAIGPGGAGCIAED